MPCNAGINPYRMAIARSLQVSRVAAVWHYMLTELDKESSEKKFTAIISARVEVYLFKESVMVSCSHTCNLQTDGNGSGHLGGSGFQMMLDEISCAMIESRKITSEKCHIDHHHWFASLLVTLPTVTSDVHDRYLYFVSIYCGEHSYVYDNNELCGYAMKSLYRKSLSEHITIVTIFVFVNCTVEQLTNWSLFATWK